MYVAVKLYKDIPDKPTGIPDIWPAEVRQIVSPQDSPGPEWIVMKCSDLVSYKARFKELYESWVNLQTQEPSQSGEEE